MSAGTDARIVEFHVGAATFRSMTELLRAAEHEAARLVAGRPQYNVAAVYGIDDRGGIERLGNLVVEGGGYELQSIEPVPFDDDEGEA